MRALAAPKSTSIPLGLKGKKEEPKTNTRLCLVFVLGSYWRRWGNAIHVHNTSSSAFHQAYCSTFQKKSQDSKPKPNDRIILPRQNNHFSRELTTNTKGIHAKKICSKSFIATILLPFSAKTVLNMAPNSRLSLLVSIKSCIQLTIPFWL